MIPRVRTLDRKMLRELWRLRSQLLSIGLVVATGVTTVVTLRGTYEALYRAREAYYREYRLADVWSALERAPEPLGERIALVPGVSAVATRVATYATLDLPWLEAPGLGLFLSIPDRGRPPLDDIHVTRGRLPDPGRSAEVVASQAFFLANGLSLGDTVRAVLNGRRTDLRIVGVAISPEHSYSVPPGALYPDDHRYGVFWMARSGLGAALDVQDAFNQVAVSLAPGGSERAVIRALNRILEPYGGLGAYGREQQLSYKILDDELAQNRTIGTIVPAIFLGVAAFLLNLVLGRLIATQRTEIGTLKAFGYSEAEIGWHYLSYALVAVGIGTVVGALGGVWAGDAMVGLYGAYFTFPELEYELSAGLVLIGSLVSLVAAVGGAWAAVRRATRLTPAEAMRPEPPPRFRPGWVERAGLGRALPTGGRLILRNMERRPLRSILSSLGVAFSVAILVVGTFLFDGISRAMELQFSVAQREDLAATFNRPLSADVVLEMAALDGVRRAEPVRMVPARLVAGHRSRELALGGLEPGSRLRAIVDADGRAHPLPLEGLVLSAFLADELGVGPGSAVTVEVLDGRRQTGRVVVARVVDDFLGSAAHVSLEALERLTGDGRLVSGVLLETDPAEAERLGAELKDTPAVVSVVSPATMLASFEDRLEDSLYVSIAFMLGFAGVISVAVIYNGTRIALSERGRELASLRVLGFTRREVAALLLGEQAVVTVLAIPIGCAIGFALAALVLAVMASETYRIPLVVSGRTYLIAASVTILAAWASGWVVRRRLDRMDLIAVLKTRE